MNQKSLDKKKTKVDYSKPVEPIMTADNVIVGYKNVQNKTKPSEGKGIKIYQRIYDNPLNKDGTKKPNKLLGTFKIKGGLPNDYSYTCYGYKNHKLYKIIGREVSYENGGTAHTICPIEKCEDVIAYKNLKEKDCEL